MTRSVALPEAAQLGRMTGPGLHRLTGLNGLRITLYQADCLDLLGIEKDPDYFQTALERISRELDGQLL